MTKGDSSHDNSNGKPLDIGIRNLRAAVGGRVELSHN